MNVLKHLIKIAFALSIISSHACDICSCGASNNTMVGINSNHHYLGISYHYLQFKFKDGIHDNSPYGYDDIHQFTLHGQYKIAPKLALQLFVPMQNNNRKTADDKAANSGLGDVTLKGIYTFYHNANHILKSGFGVKFPTGKFNLSNASTTNTSATQLGTGSFDVGLPLAYTYHDQKFSTKLNATYFYKTENSMYFKFGNQTQIQLLASYKILAHSKYTYSLSLGGSYDAYQETETSGSKNLRTDGYLLNSNIGLSFESKKLVIGTSYQLPIDQKLIDGDVTFKKGLGVYTYWKF